MQLKQQPKLFLFNIVPMYRPGLQEIYEYGRSEGYIDGQWKAAYTIPNLACRIKQNTLYKGFEGVAGAGLAAMDQLLILASDGGDSDFATINWVNPSIRKATKVGALTYTNKLGFTTGATTYLNTNYITTGSSNFTLNTCGFGIYVNTESANTTGIDCGVIFSSRLHQLFSRRSDTTVNFSITTASSDSVAHGSSRGLWHIKRTGAGTSAAYKNGALIHNGIAAASGVVPGASFFIGGRNNAGVMDQPASRQYGMFWIGASLSGQEAALNTAWNTYFSSL